jgi:hypothetical protein
MRVGGAAANRGMRLLEVDNLRDSKQANELEFHSESEEWAAELTDFWYECCGREADHGGQSKFRCSPISAR